MMKSQLDTDTILAIISIFGQVNVSRCVLRLESGPAQPVVD